MRKQVKIYFIKDTKVKDPVISDHLAIHCVLSIQKPQFRKKLINFRKLHSLNMDSFCKDIMDSPLLQDQATDLDTMVDQYDRVLRQVLDQVCQFVSLNWQNA